MPDDPGVEAQLQCALEGGAGRVFGAKVFFHELCRLLCSAERAEILAGLREGCAVGRDRAVVIEPKKQIVFLFRSDFREQEPRQVRRAVNLLERRFQNRTERIMRQPPQRPIRGRAREAFRARQLDRGHSQPFDVARVSDRAHRDAIVNLEKFLPRFSEGEKQDPVAKSKRADWVSARQPCLAVFRAVRDCLDPAIWLFDHATLRLKIFPIFFSGNVVMPSRETILMTGKIFACRSTPPVAVSDSAAVSSARSATATASSSLSFASGFFPQLFS